MVSPGRPESILKPVQEKAADPNPSSSARGSWKTRVLISVNVHHCELKVNMGNLMGNST